MNARAEVRQREKGGRRGKVGGGGTANVREKLAQGSVPLFVCARRRVCVRERESACARERERERKTERERE